MLLRNNMLLSATRKIQDGIGKILNSLLILVRDVSLYYRVRLLSSKHDASIDFNAVFGGQIAAFHRRKNHVIDGMWEHSVGDAAVMGARSLRKRLGPQDSSLQRLLNSDDVAPSERGEYTCEWFQSHLLAFSRSKDDTLALFGPMGCGKSVLSRWVIERLQRPLGKKSFNTLACTIEADAPAEATSLAIVKRLLRQLLEINVGHKRLYTDLSKAFSDCAENHSDDLETKLWECLEGGLKRSEDTDNFMILIDGLDHIHGGDKSARAVMNRLAALAVKQSRVQLIVTSQSKTLEPDNGNTRTFEIKPDHTHHDLYMVIDQCLADSRYFRGRSEHAQEHLVDQIVHAARGNFLWAVLYPTILKHETSEDGFNKAAKAAKDSTLSLDDIISKVFNFVDLAAADTGLLLSLMLVADRPLRVGEMAQLLEIDVGKKSTTERGTETIRKVTATLGMLVRTQSEFIRFSHSAVRFHLRKVQEDGKKLRSPLDTQNEMSRRLLAYCNSSLPRNSNPTTSQLSPSEVEKVFSSYVLMEYAVRYWTKHFRCSAMYRDNDVLPVGDDFKSVFPSTIQFSLLEWACWEFESYGSTATATMDLGLRVRKATFSDQHISVLQSLIICGTMWRDTGRTNEAVDCFYQASTIGQGVLSRFHVVTAACTTTFLTIIESKTFTSRTELATRKETMLIYTIDFYKSLHGKTHDLVIRYSKILAKLYINIHEEHRSESVYRELREIMIARYGKGSEEETSISENLTIVLKKGDKKTDVVEYEQGIFDIITELEVFNIR